MNYIPVETISASKAIEYMKFRLSAEKKPSAGIELKNIEENDRMIEHVRSRLKTVNWILRSEP